LPSFSTFDGLRQIIKKGDLKKKILIAASFLATTSAMALNLKETKTLEYWKTSLSKATT
jgi:hypothetical protein